MSVSIYPGSTRFALMPFPPYSLARDRVRPRAHRVSYLDFTERKRQRQRLTDETGLGDTVADLPYIPIGSHDTPDVNN